MRTWQQSRRARKQRTCGKYVRFCGNGCISFFRRGQGKRPGQGYGHGQGLCDGHPHDGPARASRVPAGQGYASSASSCGKKNASTPRIYIPFRWSALRGGPQLCVPARARDRPARSRSRRGPKDSRLSPPRQGMGHPLRRRDARQGFRLGRHVRLAEKRGRRPLPRRQALLPQPLDEQRSGGGVSPRLPLRLAGADRTFPDQNEPEPRGRRRDRQDARAISRLLHADVRPVLQHTGADVEAVPVPRKRAGGIGPGAAVPGRLLPHPRRVRRAPGASRAADWDYQRPVLHRRPHCLFLFRSEQLGPRHPVPRGHAPALL